MTIELCPSCRWTWVEVPGIEVIHECGYGERLRCLTCGWTWEVWYDARPGFSHALAEVHTTRPGH